MVMYYFEKECYNKNLRIAFRISSATNFHMVKKNKPTRTPVFIV